jgi:predicted NBD/HSP70 family sugar kinase
MITVVDIGATKTLVAQFTEHGTIESQVRFLTPAHQSEFYEELLHVLKKLAPPKLIVIGVPGIVDSLGVVKRCGRLAWLDFDLKGLLQKDFPALTVKIENDAKLAALSETNAIKPLPDACLYLTISTGIGEGVVKNGKLVEALKYSEAGHMMLNDEGQLKSWQNIASGQAIKQHFGKMAKDLKSPEEWKWVCEKLATGMVALIPTIQPDVIILGGSIGTHFSKFATQLQDLLEVRLPKFIKRPQLLQAKHPEEAVIYGCYYYATHQQNS